MPSPKYRARGTRCGEEKAEQDRQWQTDAEKSLREAQIAPDDTKIRVGGIGEQNHGEGQLGQKAQPLAGYLDAQYAQPIGAEDKTDDRENDRPADQGPFDPARDRAVDQKKNGEKGGILVHLRQISSDAERWTR